ncbi:precorrin-3B synthase [Bartonella sp. HY329]|uniref:precorrin-3B synthase n=1 Tax=unclassified Bartonella TaxID=2645622 RepID=UPI0021CA67C8|nr:MULTISPECIES: precorrin-3B synthase [unclassified Bartonella]UXM96215.1 precorrin-3B synthase [Bartonella sp. HY329]UXN10539.1 precorrin-3B synthase [Bartonella sp. HY328]
MTKTKSNNQNHDDRRWACPGLFRMPASADGGICRIKLEQGQVDATQLRALAKLVDGFGDGLLEVTTRANVQIRGVTADNSASLSQKLVMAGFGPKIKNGDDVRNIMVNPTAGFDPLALRDIRPFAQELSLYVQTHYQNLSPKFSFLIDGGESCAVLDHKSDIWLSLCDEGQNFAFGVASCPTTSTSRTQALGKIVFEQGHQLIYALIDLLFERQKYAPQLQRMKHLQEAISNEDIIAYLKSRQLDIYPADHFIRNSKTSHYLGIYASLKADHYYLGVKPPLARLTPLMLNLLANIVDEYTQGQGLIFTPWQSIIFANCSLKQANDINNILAEQGFIVDINDVRGKIIACAGAPKCAKALSNTLLDAENLASLLLPDDLDNVHLTGCPKSCAATKAYPTTFVAIDNGLYDIYSSALAPKEQGFGTLIGHKLNLKQAAKLINRKALPII